MVTNRMQQSRFITEARPNQGSRRGRRVALTVGVMAAAVVYAKENMEEKSSDFVEDWGKRLQQLKDEVDMDNLFTKVEGFSLPTVWVESIKELRSFQVRPDDVFVISFPKSGTTWLQQIVYLVMNGSAVAETETRSMEERFPYLEYPMPGVKVINNLPSPRMIKTHLPFMFLPREINKAKVLYIARNPKDAVVSYYFYTRMFALSIFYNTFEECFEEFVHDKVAFSPWSEHVNQYWERRNDENILFLTYEGLSQDLPSNVRKIAKFLGKEISEDEVQAICHHCSFASMKKNKTTNYSWLEQAGLRRKGEEDFMRKGKVGDWKNHLTPEMNGKVEGLISKTPAGLQELLELKKESATTTK